MKKAVSLIVCIFILASAMVGCVQKAESGLESSISEKEVEQTAGILLVIHEERAETYSGKAVRAQIQKYAQENEYETKETVIKEGATIEEIKQQANENWLVVLLGQELQFIAENAQTLPEFTFIWADATNPIKQKNVYQFGVNQQQMGWLAGTIALQENYYECGVADVGMAEDASLGFNKGAHEEFKGKKAAELEVLLLSKVDLQGTNSKEWAKPIINFYQMAGNMLYLATPLGVEEIIQAAEQEGGKAIVLDDAKPSENVLAVLQRDLSSPMEKALNDWKEGTLAVGSATILSVQEARVSINLEKSNVKQVTHETFAELLIKAEENNQDLA